MARAATGGVLKFHDVQFRGTIDRITLCAAFVLGVGLGVSLKVMGFHPFTVAGFTAAILFAYAAIAYYFGGGRLEPETVGDNCYYLGFLFTLTSLAFTLYQIAPSGTEVDAQKTLFADVISGFGVALVSTIVGVFLRVLLMQISPDIVARDREMRLELHQSVRDMRTALNSSISDLKNFATESVQLASERDEKLRSSTEEAISANLASMNAMSAKTAEQASDWDNKIRASTETAIGKANDQLQDNSVKVFELIERSFGDAVENSARKIEEKVVESSKSSMGKIESALSDVAGAVEKVSKANVDLAEKQSGVLAGIESELSDVQEKLAKTSDKFDQLGTKLDDLIQKVDRDVGGSLEQSKASLAKAAENFEATLSEITSAFDRASIPDRATSLSNSFAEPVERLNEISQRIAESSSLIAPKRKRGLLRRIFSRSDQ